MAVNCILCHKKVLNHARYISCSACLSKCHLNCLPNVSPADNIFIDRINNVWFCFMCLSDNLPFCHFKDDDEFYSAISDNWASKAILTLADLDGAIFNPFDTNVDHMDAFLEENDPDVNYFNDIRMNMLSSNYFLEDSFNNKCTQLSIQDSCFSITHANVRSVHKNLSKLEEYLFNLKVRFSVIALSETWLSESNSSLYAINGYSGVNNPRTNRKGGGVALHIRNDILFNVREDLMVSNDVLETCFIQIDKTVYKTEHDIIVGVVYRPPNTNVSLFNEHLSQLLDDVKPNTHKVYLAGDYNINLLNYNEHSQTSDFVDLMYSSALFPLICKPTRVQNNTATLIDNIFHNVKENVNVLNGILVTDISDHYPVFHIDYSTQVTNIETCSYKRIFSKHNIQQFHDEMCTFDWSRVLNCTDAQRAFTLFHTTLCNSFNKNFPITKIVHSYKNKKTWLTIGLKHSIKLKNKLYLKCKTYPSSFNVENYKHYRNKLNKLLKVAERKHYDDLFEHNKSNLKKTWSIIKDVINKKKANACPKSFKINNQMSDDKNLIANGFNNYFANIGKNLASLIPNSSINPTSFIDHNIDDTIFLNPVDESEVRKLIFDVKKNSSGWDGICCNVLKETHLDFLTPLTHVYNLSLSQGIFPSELKIAKVIPLYKAGDNTLFINYRPISVLSVFSKLLEKIMYSRLIAFINKCKILHELQFGFRKDHSTGLALTILVDKITEALDRGDYSIGIFLDFSKAFDTVDHSILFQKLSFYGIRGLAYEWIVSYLTDRRQFVSFNGKDSDLTNIQCGVPQGSVLGPLLFLLYINDISNVSQMLYMLLFADDTSALLSGSNLSILENCINVELDKVVKWLNCNKLSLNVDKSHFIIFSTRSMAQQMNINLNGKELKQVVSTKFLGVHIDEKLNWKCHINYLKGKIARGLGILNASRKHFNRKTLLNLYYSFIYPLLYYNIEVWGSACPSNLLCLVTLQKRCVRIITSSKWNAHTPVLFKQLNIITLHNLYSVKLMLFLYKYVNGHLSTLFANFFTEHNVFHNYSTRSCNLFCVPLARTVLRKRTIRFMAVKVYNNMKIHCNFSDKIIRFKRNVKRFYIDLL